MAALALLAFAGAQANDARLLTETPLAEQDDRGAGQDSPWLYPLLRSDFAMVAEIVEVGRSSGFWSGWGMSTQKVKYRVLRTPWGQAPGEVVDVEHILVWGDPDLKQKAPRLDQSRYSPGPGRARLDPKRFFPGRRVIVFAAGQYDHAVGQWPRELPARPSRYIACQPETGTPAADVESVRELYRAIAQWRVCIRDLCAAAGLVFVGWPERDFTEGPYPPEGDRRVEYEVAEVLKGESPHGPVQVLHTMPPWGRRGQPRLLSGEQYDEIRLFFSKAVVFAVRNEGGDPPWRDVSPQFSALPARPVNLAEVRQTLLLLPRGEPEE
jgi:hypothetical protein